MCWIDERFVISVDTFWCQMAAWAQNCEREGVKSSGTMLREGLGEEWLKWGDRKIRHLESWSWWQSSLWVLVDENDWADQQTAVGKVRRRKRKKDNLLRVMKHFFQIPNQWQDVTRVGGWRQRRALQQTVIAGSVHASTHSAKTSRQQHKCSQREVKKAAAHNNNRSAAPAAPDHILFTSLIRDFFQFDKK